MANKVFGGNQIEMNAHHQYHAYHEYHCKQIFECMLSVEKEEKKRNSSRQNDFASQCCMESV